LKHPHSGEDRHGSGRIVGRRRGFPSPTGVGSPRQRDRLRQCIEEANELLRTLGNPQDEQNLRALQLRFRAMRGFGVEASVACGTHRETVRGRLLDAGRDYLDLCRNDKRFFVPFAKLLTVARSRRHVPSTHGHHEELAGLSPELKRALVLDFANTVSRRPELINIFFGLPLHLRLASFCGERVRVKTDQGDGTIVSGVLVGTSDNAFEVQTGKREIRRVRLEEVCYIRL